MKLPETSKVKASEFADRQTETVGTLMFGHTEAQKLISSMDSSWEKQTIYGWANMTVLVPDPGSQEWKDLWSVQENEEKG